MDEQREELRLALVMNGGVSLAVWMGGVSNEIFRVVTQQHPVYTALLDMTQTTARVDVISGTSAGGVNGAALSLALLYGGDFSLLRDVWLKTGALSSLLRAPIGENPGSLLRGDDFFLPEIQEAFARLTPEAQPVFDPGVMPIDLRLTTTLLRGEQGHSVDDLGTAIHDVDYRAQFRFRHDRRNLDFMQRDPLLPMLARAARSTASFPFAFEPSPVKGLGDRFVDSQDRPIGESKLEDTSQEVVPRFVVDGGVLDNKPFRGALRSIFAMPAQRGVRRVVAYINPDPGDGPPGSPRKDPPPLSSVLSSSLFGIQQSQTIADHLADIQEHNDHVRTRRDSVFDTVFNLNDDVLERLPRDLFELYRQRRLESTFDGFVLDELPGAAERLKLSMSLAQSVVGRRGRARLLAAFMSVKWNGWIPLEWPEDCPPRGPLGAPYEDKDWEWGLFPVEFAIKVVLDVLRRAQHLTDLDPDGKEDRMEAQERSARSTSGAEPPDWNDPAVRPAPPGGAGRRLWNRTVGTLGVKTETYATWDREAIRAQAEPTPNPLHPWLKRAWRSIYHFISRIERMRLAEQGDWDRNAERLLLWMKPEGRNRELDVDAITGESFIELFEFLVTEKRRRHCGILMRLIARVMVEAAQPALDLAKRVADDPDLPEHDRASARMLGRFLEWTVPLGGHTRQWTVICQLMRLEVIEHAHNVHDALSDDCMIELAQISGNATSPLGGPRAAKDKLLGLQLAHFGAFYRRSWRANDWTYGRLDGSERMVKILLNPDRLRRFFRDRASAAKRITAIAIDDIASRVLHAEVAMLWLRHGYANKLWAELAFLDDKDAAIPDALPVATAVVTLRLHFGILREEIEPLLVAISVDQAEGADALGPSQSFVKRFAKVDSSGKTTLPFSPEQAREALDDGLIAGETLLDEAGSDLFTRTLAHTVATLQGVLSSKASKLGPVSVFFAGLKLPILGFYFVVRGLTRQSRTSAALHGGILAIGMTLVAAQLILHQTKDAKLLPDSVIGFGWALLAYGLLFSIASSPRLAGLLIVAVLLGLQFALKIEVMPVIVVLGALLVLWISVKVRVLAVLQWLMGIAVVVLAARWSRGADPQWPPLDFAYPVDQIAGLVCLVLLLATWMASGWARRAEGGMRGILRGLARSLQRGFERLAKHF